MQPSTSTVVIGAIAALLVGFAKTGIPGIAIVIVPLLAMVFPAKTSVGVLLPMLIMGDFFAVGFYRRHAQWRKLASLLPAVAAGMLVATWTLSRISDQQMKPFLGWLVLTLVGLELIRRQFGWESIPHHWAFALVMGFLAGFGTTIGNAAGPVMTVYLISRGLDKNQFMGTTAWFFMLVNATKLPIFWTLGMITPQSLGFDLLGLPLIAVGALLGRALLPRLPQRAFNTLALALAVAGALKLLL